MNKNILEELKQMSERIEQLSTEIQANSQEEPQMEEQEVPQTQEEAAPASDSEMERKKAMVIAKLKNRG